MRGVERGGGYLGESIHKEIFEQGAPEGEIEEGLTGLERARWKKKRGIEEKKKKKASVEGAGTL
jgi:hypothetical protein